MRRVAWTGGARGLALVLLGVLVLVSLGVSLALPFVGASRIADTEERWEAVGRPLDAPALAQAAPPADESALELERLARRVGVELAPLGAPRRQGAASAAFPWGEARAWVEAFVRCASCALDEPPAAVEEAFTEDAEAWEELVVHLLDDEPPSWRPTLRGLMDTDSAHDPGAAFALLRLLDARVLVAAHGGRPVEAERTLLAGWRLVDAIADDDWLHAHLFLPMVRAEQAILLRRLTDADSEAWLPRLGRRSWQGTLADHLQANAAAMIRSADRGELDVAAEWARARRAPPASAHGSARRADELVDSVKVALLTPMDAARHLDHLRGVVQAIDESVPCSAVDPVASLTSEWSWPRAAPWNAEPFADVARAWMADAQEELTARVLEARMLRGAVGDAWTRGACADVTYVLEGLPGERRRVVAHHPAHEESLGSLLDLPLAHEESRSP